LRGEAFHLGGLLSKLIFPGMPPLGIGFLDYWLVSIQIFPAFCLSLPGFLTIYGVQLFAVSL
jgi:hypothetical protein